MCYKKYHFDVYSKSKFNLLSLNKPNWIWSDAINAKLVWNIYNQMYFISGHIKNPSFLKDNFVLKYNTLLVVGPLRKTQ